MQPAIGAELAACLADPARFNETILAWDPLWWRQREMGYSLVKYRTTVCPTGNGVGKSRFAAVSLLWFAALHPGSWAVVAAPTMGQLSNVVWKEVVRGHQSAANRGVPLGGKFSGLTLEFGPDWAIEGYGQGSVESKSGRHAGDLLAVIDEASGVHPAVLEAIDSLNPSKYLYLGNPLRPEGRFFDLVENSAENPHVNVIRIPSTESPDIHLERSRRGMADQTWLESARYDYGEDSLWWASHVEARFPGELDQALLPMRWLELAARTVHVRSGPIRLGVDIAKGNEGDDSQIVARDDNGVLHERHSNRWDMEELARQVRLCQLEYGVLAPHVVYDAVGVGTDFDNRLRQVGIVGARGYQGFAPGGPKFANLRSAAAWQLRRRLDPNRGTPRPDGQGGGSRLQWQAPGPDAGGLVYLPQKPFAIPRPMVDRFRKELSSCRYGLNDAGQIALEAKAEFVKRLKFSPNFLDALMMTFAFVN